MKCTKLLKVLLLLGLHVGATRVVAEGGEGVEKLILVVLSSEDKVTLNKDRVGTSELKHQTGFFLTELMVPLKAVLDEGYQPVFSTPMGSKPVMDPVSDNAFWFGGSEREYRSYRALCERWGLCGDGRIGAAYTRSFEEVLSEGLDSYAGVFFPGGHAPMEDLYKNRQLGKILNHFHQNQKPTALICHAPIALLSTLARPGQFGLLLEQLNELNANPAANQQLARTIQGKLAEHSADWIYRGYQMTSFSTKEEQQEEPGGADDVLGGFMKFYPDEALDFAGAKVTIRAQKWQSNVVQDRELITGQNPFSDKEFAGVLVKALKET